MVHAQGELERLVRPAVDVQPEERRDRPVERSLLLGGHPLFDAALLPGVRETAQVLDRHRRQDVAVHELERLAVLVPVQGRPQRRVARHDVGDAPGERGFVPCGAQVEAEGVVIGHRLRVELGVERHAGLERRHGEGVFDVGRQGGAIGVGHQRERAGRR